MGNRSKVTARVALPDGTTRTITPIGRDAWALENLVIAGSRGCTPITTPGPRWSGYVHKLRKKYGLSIRTIEEKHDGQFAGTHARYVLVDHVEIVTRAGA